MKRSFTYIEDIDIRKTINDFYDSLLNMKGKYYNYCTDFFNPKELEYAKSLLDEDGSFNYLTYGGSATPEQAVILFGSALDENDIDIKDYAKIVTLYDIPRDIKHSDVLGAILNQGIHRKKIGDIIFDNRNCHIVCTKAVGNYLIANLIKIKNHKIKIVENTSPIIPAPVHEFIRNHYILTSLRLDQFISSVCHLSRQQSKKKVQKGHVKLNYERILRPSYEIRKGDMVSIRHYGRFILKDITGQTRKNNNKCIIDKFK